MARSKLEKALIGPAGEHYVLYRLHMLGIMAAQAPRNAPTVDVLVFGEDESMVAAVQVKSRTTGTDGGWHMGKKHETMRGPRLFYAFVDFEPSAPRTYVVPSATVADVLTASHRAWLAIPGKKGPHKDSDMRRILPTYGFEVPGFSSGWLNTYADRWDHLRL